MSAARAPRALHWAGAGLVLALAGTRLAADGLGAAGTPFLALHLLAGGMLLPLTLWRLRRWGRGASASAAARVMHLLLLLLLLALIATGAATFVLAGGPAVLAGAGSLPDMAHLPPRAALHAAAGLVQIWRGRSGLSGCPT